MTNSQSVSVVIPMQDFKAAGSSSEDVCGHVVDDVDKWANSCREKMHNAIAHAKQVQPCKIGRIPENFHEDDRRAYEPIMVSIGPYYHGMPGLQEKETQKLFYLNHVLENIPGVALEDYINEIKGVEQEARNFYPDVDMDTEKFVCMLLLDSLYILVSLVPDCLERRSPKNMGIDNNNEAPKGSPVSTNPSKRSALNWNNIFHYISTFFSGSQETHGIVLEDEINGVESGQDDDDCYELPVWGDVFFLHDIFLFENQFPFFVLEKIYILACSSDRGFLEAMKWAVHGLLPNHTKNPSHIKLKEEKVYHLLHLCHIFLRPTPSNSSSEAEGGCCCCIRLPTRDRHPKRRPKRAAKLKQAGVSFARKCDPANQCLLDITFNSSGTMDMPCLVIDDLTNSLFRNLIALEQMTHGLNYEVSAYIMLLVYLISEPEDVELLERKGIIDHHLASTEEVAIFINRLSRVLSLPGGEQHNLLPVINGVMGYSNCRMCEWKAWLKIKYFSNPWLFMSLLAAIFLLLLTVLQTFYTVYPYYSPSKRL